jgi:hypothetical protein
MTNQTYLTRNKFSNNTIFGKRRFGERISFWNLGAAGGLIGGLLLVFGTLFLNIAEFFYGEKEHGEWLFIVALLLLMFGAHCLDKIGDIRKAKKIAYLEMHAKRFEND